jgi:hypothetical protein
VTGPGEGLEVESFDLNRMLNLAGASLVEGQVVAVHATQLNDDGKPDGLQDVGTTDALGAILGVVQDLTLAENARGRIRVQGRVRRALLGGTIAAGGLGTIDPSSNRIVPTNGTSKRKIVFRAEEGGDSGDFVQGMFDGWAGFGTDLV